MTGGGKDGERPLKFLWDQRRTPLTFDFGVYLTIIECYRQLVRPGASIDLTVRADGFREGTPRDQSTSAEEKRWRLKSIIMDLCELVPTISTLAVTDRDRGPYDFPPEGQVASYLATAVGALHAQGANPRVLKAPTYAVQKIPFPKPYVTFTLRMSRHFQDRNINPENWYRFYKDLRAAGYNVVVVPDQEDFLDERLYSRFDWPVYEAACLDIRLRYALYQNARMNFGSSNGPVALIFFTEAPVLQFDQLRVHQDSAFWLRINGFPAGQQYPWSTPNQRMTWTDSSYENLVKEWDALKLQ